MFDKVNTNKLEEKETLDLPMLNVIYRDNELFKTLVPKITQNAKDIGRKVETHLFPQGTPEEEINKWFENEENRKKLKNTDFLLDDTCYSQASNSYDRYKELEVRKTTELDSLSKKIMGHSVLGENLYEKGTGEKIETQLDGLKSIVKFIFEKNGEPENLFIVQKYISSHNFNGSNKTDDEKKLFNQEFDKSLNGVNVSREEFEKIAGDYNYPDNEKRKKLLNTKQEVWGTLISLKIKDSLKEIINEEKIKIVSSVDNIEDGDKNYVIVDRHALKEGEERNKVTLPLPLDSMVDYIIKKNLLDINFDVDKAVREEVEKEFSK